MQSDGSAREARTWRTGRAAAGALGLIFAILYLLEGQGLPLGRMRAPGPGIFPLIVGIIFAAVSIGVIIDALKSQHPGQVSFPKGEDLTRVLLVSGSFLLYVVLMDVLGFIVSTLGLVLCFTKIVGKVSWPVAIASSAFVTLAVWAVFVLALGVRLPTGIWS